jgi:hypothetical protein
MVIMFPSSEGSGVGIFIEINPPPPPPGRGANKKIIYQKVITNVQVNYC